MGVGVIYRGDNQSFVKYAADDHTFIQETVKEAPAGLRFAGLILVPKPDPSLWLSSRNYKEAAGQGLVLPINIIFKACSHACGMI